MHLRVATTADIDEIAELYKNTITAVNGKDYTKEQIAVWAATSNNQEGWIERIEEQHFYLATIDEKMVGFASIDYNGYIDLMYVHKDYQRQGIATGLLEALEKTAKGMGFSEITVQSSITAKPFFLKHRFIQTGEKHKEINGVPFTNSIMAKKI